MEEGSVGTVNVYQFYYYEPTLGQLYPGQRRTKFYSWDWRNKSATATAMPFDAWGQDRSLEVQDLRMRSYGLADPNASPTLYVQLDVVNVGRDAVFIYMVELAAFIR
jgi:hypothetical protein